MTMHEPQKGNRFAVFSKFPAWAILAVDEMLILPGNHVDFDLMVVTAPSYTAKADGRTIEELALDWMNNSETHRVRMVFYDEGGNTSRTFNISDVKVSYIRIENINSNSDGDVVLRVNCAGKLEVE